MIRLVVILATLAALFASLSGSALASETLGSSVSACAQMHLGPRANAPGLTCSHDGTTVTFPTFGEMVRHMQAGC